MAIGNIEYKQHVLAREAHPPEVIYTYASAEKSALIVGDKRFRFCSPMLFNDPFDCQWNIHWPAYTDQSRAFGLKLFKQALLDPSSWPQKSGSNHLRAAAETRAILLKMSESERTAKIEEMAENYLFSEDVNIRAENKFHDILRRMRIQCMTDNPTSLLMWSHYANQHQGFALGFDSKVLEDEYQRPFEKVKYVENLPVLIDVKEWYEGIVFGLPRKRAENIVEEVCLSKSIDWAYEDEWRFVWIDAHRSDGDVTYQAFPSNALVEVVVGCRAKKQEVDEFIELCQSVNSNISVRQLKKHQSKFSVV